MNTPKTLPRDCIVTKEVMSYGWSYSLVTGHAGQLTGPETPKQMLLDPRGNPLPEKEKIPIGFMGRP